VLTLDDLGDEEVALLAAAIAQVARELARTLPRPRGAPCFGLDLLDGPVGDPRDRDAFCHQGIFRKYQCALVLGGGFGGAARWWAAHFGCTAVNVAARPSMAAGGARLNAPGGPAGRVRFVAGALGALPVRAHAFTHAWILAAVTRREPPGAILGEAWRALRPGGFLGVEVAASARDAPAVAPWTDAIAAAGFGAVTTRLAVPSAFPEFRLVAEQRLRVVIAERTAASSPLRTALAYLAGRRTGSPAVHLFAQRPS
jgi:SAM-dependent methyltransferase